MSLEPSSSSKYTYQYRFRFGQLLNLTIGLGLLGISLYFATQFEVDRTLLAIICFLSLIGLTPLLLTLHYLIRSFGLTIQIDQNLGTFEVAKNGRTNTYRLEDITSIEICEQESIGLYGFDFDFAKYTFSSGKFCVTTNHMTNQYFIPTGIEPRIYKKIFPIIKKQTNV